MAGGLFVFVRTAPPGGCALAITAGQYRPLAAHSPCRNTSGGAFSFFAACAILRCHAGLRSGIAILVFFTLFLSHNVSLILV